MNGRCKRAFPKKFQRLGERRSSREHVELERKNVSALHPLTGGVAQQHRLLLCKCHDFRVSLSWDCHKTKYFSIKDLLQTLPTLSISQLQRTAGACKQ